jgi:hypothetical protein
MGHNLIPDPAGMQLATDAEVEQLFPFSWNIAQFRGRRIGERGLIVHYKPQASHAVGHGHIQVLAIVIVGSVPAVACNLSSWHMAEILPFHSLLTCLKDALVCSAGADAAQWPVQDQQQLIC